MNKYCRIYVALIILSLLLLTNLKLEAGGVEGSNSCSPVLLNEVKGPGTLGSEPEVSITVDTDAVDFGFLVPGEISGSTPINICNTGNGTVNVTARIGSGSDSLYEDGLHIDGGLWDQFHTTINKDKSHQASVKLHVPDGYLSTGTKNGTLVFWGEPNLPTYDFPSGVEETHIGEQWMRADLFTTGGGETGCCFLDDNVLVISRNGGWGPENAARLEFNFYYPNCTMVTFNHTANTAEGEEQYFGSYAITNGARFGGSMNRLIISNGFYCDGDLVNPIGTYGVTANWHYDASYKFGDVHGWSMFPLIGADVLLTDNYDKQDVVTVGGVTYAVSYGNTPSTHTLHIGKNNGTSCSEDIEGLGATWPSVGGGEDGNVIVYTWARDNGGVGILYQTNYTAQAMSVSVQLSATIGRKYTIDLSAGWDLISIPLVQVNTSINEVLKDIEGKWDYVQYYEASDPTDHWKTHATYKPQKLNDLSEINRTMGFWLHTTEACTLNVMGNEPTSMSIPLYAGWNLVGYPTLNDTVKTADALAGTGYDKVEGFNATAPYRISQLADDYIMKPGEGYWVHVPADTTWVVDW